MYCFFRSVLIQVFFCRAVVVAEAATKKMKDADVHAEIEYVKHYQIFFLDITTIQLYSILQLLNYYYYY